MASTTRTRPPVDLMMLLNEAAHALTTELAAGLAGVGVTPREHCVLSKSLGGDLTQREIAALSGIDKTTMVATVDRLESAGLAERRPSATDRRARIVAITPAGREVLAQADGVVARVYDDVLATLPPGERTGFIAALQRLVEGEGRLSSPVAGQGVRRSRATNPSGPSG